MLSLFPEKLADHMAAENRHLSVDHTETTRPCRRRPSVKLASVSDHLTDQSGKAMHECHLHVISVAVHLTIQAAHIFSLFKLLMCFPTPPESAYPSAMLWKAFSSSYSIIHLFGYFPWIRIKLSQLASPDLSLNSPLALALGRRHTSVSVPF